MGAAFGVGVAGGPVFGREGDVPEHGVRQEELDANFDLLVGKTINMRDHALEGIFGLRIRESEALPAIHRGANGNQRAVGAYGQRAGFFFRERGVACVQADADGDFH